MIKVEQCNIPIVLQLMVHPTEPSCLLCAILVAFLTMPDVRVANPWGQRMHPVVRLMRRVSVSVVVVRQGFVAHAFVAAI